MIGSALPLLVVLSSLLAGLIIFTLPEGRRGLRTVINLTGALSKLVLIGFMLWGVYHGVEYELRYPLLPGLDLVLRADPLALLFVTLSAGLWLLTTVYAIAYLEHEGSGNRSRFFGFFSLCVSATVGIAMAGNPFTFFVFYEILTLVTYPLVVHRGTEAALRAGRVYLAYTLSGGVVLLVGLVWLYALAGPVEFAAGGVLADAGLSHGILVALFVLLIGGLGVKCALFPLHGWLPVAMVAPAPVSALLHAVAVVKAGAFGIVRVVYEIYGVEFARDLGLMWPLASLAAFTIIYASLRALMQEDLKRRLAFSTVSQLSYIVLGVAIVGPLATLGGVVHLVHQGVMKITLFFCAGNYAETLHIHRVSELNGVGRRMPWTTAAFTVGALGMMGMPPIAGFVSKWYLGLGALESGQGLWIAVLAGSTLLNAAYFLPLLYRAWFLPTTAGWADPRPRPETGRALLWPPVITAAISLLIGLFAAAAWSPLAWTALATREQYAP
ncbi:monovalent cation/H+ antiporter subunit D family protein [Ectothiorhodospiraceae bacterium 2226]|nr:monovalent cation/H+ antiporter subunit D family protein [Ectothiorhodospiraceae bacterium 2226]